MFTVKRIRTREGQNFFKAIESMSRDKEEMVGTGFWADQKKKLDEEKNYPMSTIAYINEFGTKGTGETSSDFGADIPPRPFMRPAFRTSKKVMKAFIYLKTKEGLRNGKIDLEKIFTDSSIWLVGDIRSKIQKLRSPKLAPYTIEKRRKRGNKSRKPLIDTGQMINSIETRTLK